MCNEIRRHLALGTARDDFMDLRIPLRFPEGLPNLAATDSIRITEPTLIIRAVPQAEPPAAEAVMRRWSWPGPRRAPVYNFRSDGRALGNAPTSGRCLIAADGFYEFTAPDPGEKRKAKWLFTKAGEDWFGIAGLWRRDETVGEAFTMLTTEPGPDIAPYHSRQIVILQRADWAGWLSGATPAPTLCRPLPAGSLTVARVR